LSKAFVQRLLKQRKIQGHVQPEKQGGGKKGAWDGYSAQLAQMVEKYPDATLSEYCEYWGETYGLYLSTSTMCRTLHKEKLTRKKSQYVAVNVPQKECKSSEVNTGSK